MRSASTLDYRSDIDGLRAIAVALVLVFHFSLLPAITGGFLGVDVFFVISGYLITGIIVRQLDAGRFSLTDFYVSRIRRLAPPLFLVLLLVTAVGAWSLFPPEFTGLIKQVFAAQFYFANFYFWRTTGYFGFKANEVFLLHTWSLGVEEQFYLLYPLCLLVLHRYARRFFWAALVLGCIGSFMLNLALIGAKPEATFYLLPTRAWQLLLGALAAGGAVRWRRAARLDALLACAGLALIALAVTTFRSGMSVPGWFALLPASGAALLLLAGQQSRGPVSRLLSAAPLVYLGRISYSLYLVHWPINVFAERLLPDYGIAWRAAMLALSVALAALCYHLVEQPARRRQFLAAAPTLLFSYAVALALTVSLTLLVMRGDGLPQRFPAAVVRLANFTADHTAALPECEYTGANSLKPCRVGAAEVEPEWLIYGDSHAWAAHQVFDQWLKGRHQGAYFVFLNGCPPVMGVHMINDKDACFDYNRNMAAFTEQHVELHRVLLVSTWRQAIEGRLSDSASALGSVDDSVRVFNDGLHQTLSNLQRLGRETYVWEPLPGAKQVVPYALARASLTHTTPDLEYSLAEYRATYRFFFDALERDRTLITAVFSPGKALCGSGRCAVSYEGSPLYFDDGHITQSTTEFWLHVLESPEPFGESRDAEVGADSPPAE